MQHIQSAAQVACATAMDCPADFSAAVTRSTQPQFGHFQCNSAMALAKFAKRAPRDIAQAVVTQLQTGPSAEWFSKVEIAGPGFINLWLSSDALSKLSNECVDAGTLGVEPDSEPLRVVVDFSSPNVAKEMHVGHLRSTIIGDCLARVLQYLGHDVLRLNHVGDWGTAFGMLIAYMQDDAADVLSGEREAKLPDLMVWYRAAKKRFDAEDDFKDRARREVVALQGGDAVAIKAWQIICDISYQAYSQVYDMLDIEITNRGESFYNDRLADVVDHLKNKDLLELSGGAKCVFLPGFSNKEGNPLPLIVQKSDGGYNYTTTDLAALDQRVRDEKADRIVYVTDAGQSLHFNMLFACAKAANLYTPDNCQLEHVPFGLVLGKSGKKLKTRSGEVERLIDLLETAATRAKDIFTERHPLWSDEQCLQAGKVLGLGAVKYADLSNHRQSDYQFSYDKMLAFEGNTAAFILYSLVRTKSLLRKFPEAGKASVELNEPAEIDLGISLLSFPDCLQALATELTPNRLTDYLYKTACLFNAFFRDCRVGGSEQQDQRLALVRWTEDVLTAGLQLLGIQTLDEM